ncbi:MAG: hypothetical protein HT580_02395 [Dechloromonas sp.]|nr:MAG: hypothetical protein HT580_02395 [Dechloromonas sp.]
MARAPRWRKHDPQFGYFGTPFLPGQGEARKPEILATKSQAEQKGMEQQESSSATMSRLLWRLASRNGG